MAPEETDNATLPPAEVVEMCLRRGLPAIAYTYTEPFTWWEYMYDVAVLAHGQGLKNILVSAGYVEKEPLRALLPYIDAANIDIKAMDDGIYRKYCGATLAPILENILAMKEAGVHIEITNLLVTDLNDSEEQVRALCRWMVENGLQDVPLHLSRFFPRYRFTGAAPTPKSTLIRARDLALLHGVETVHLGNI